MKGLGTVQASTLPAISAKEAQSIRAASPPGSWTRDTNRERLEARTSSAVWWQYLHDNYGIAYELQTVNGDLKLPADPAMTLRYAKS